MINYISHSIAFLAGAVVSGVATFFITKHICDKKHREEISKVIDDIDKNKDFEAKTEEEYAKALEGIKRYGEEHNKEPLIFEEKPDLAEYAARIRQEAYTAPDLPKTNDLIYEIQYQDLDEEQYQIIELMLYADGILCDSMDIPIKFPEQCVGENINAIMGDRDEVYIRNEKRHIDYDVCRSAKSWSEQVDQHPELQQKLEYEDALNDFYERDEDEDMDEEEDE